MCMISRKSNLLYRRGFLRFVAIVVLWSCAQQAESFWSSICMQNIVKKGRVMPKSLIHSNTFQKCSITGKLSTRQLSHSSSEQYQYLTGSNSSTIATPNIQDRFSIAPMMEYTDRFQRKFHRLLSRQTKLYTEMVTSYALEYADNPERFIQADLLDEEPVVLQLGGSAPLQIQRAVKQAVAYGYKEINLNVGCPSNKVADKGCFGAVLMREPNLVGEICLRMREEMQGRLPTVKCRIGVDELDSYEHLTNFIQTVSSLSGVSHFIIHARKAILGGKLTPAQNRMIPPLQYPVVYRLKQDFPQLMFTLNGGVNSMAEALEHLRDGKVDGVMVGRAAVNHPWQWRSADSLLFQSVRDPQLSRRKILELYGAFLDQEVNKIPEKDRRNHLCRMGIKPIFNLFHGELNGKLFRQRMTELVTSNRLPNAPGASLSPSEILSTASEVLSPEVLDEWNDASCSPPLPA